MADVPDDKGVQAGAGGTEKGLAARASDPTRSAGQAGRATLIDDGDVESRIEAAVSAVDGPGDSGVDPLIGRVINGRFEVISRLGAGGMGIVYRARQVGMDRIVAIKTLLKDRATDDKVVQRFKNEARAVSRLNHPNTIRIYDFGQMEDGTLYFAMELLEGRSLDRAIRQDGPFAARRTLHVMAQMADSLAEAHSKGIVHRDLKPENVYLSQVGDDPDFVKVLDFGVARMREQDSSQGTMTQAGVIFGTPRYMAPEQARTMAVDARADIYALGIIWYELLTGRTPFDADSPLAILMKHIQDHVPPMAVARPDVSVPAEVEAMVMKCLEKSPDRRFQTAAALGVEIRSALDHLDGRYERVVFVDRGAPAGPAGEAVPPWEAEVVVVRRRRPAALLIVIGLLALVGAGAGVAWTMYSRGHAASVASPADVIADAAPAAAVAVVPPAAPVPADTRDAAADVQKNVRIRFVTDPPGAEVRTGDRLIGVAPVFVDMPPSDVETVFTFTLEGYRTLELAAVPDQNMLLPVKLERMPASRPAGQNGQQPSRTHATGGAAEVNKPVTAIVAPSAPATVPPPATSTAPTPVPSKPASSGFEKVGLPSTDKTPDKVGDLKKF